jgi:hypothetical protein
VSTSLLYNWRSAWKAAAMAARSTAVRPAEFVQLGVVADATGAGARVPMAAGAVCPRGAGLAPHQPAVADHIGRKDRSKTTYSRHGSPGGTVR